MKAAKSSKRTRSIRKAGVRNRKTAQATKAVSRAERGRGAPLESSAGRAPGRRADFGAPIDGFFAKQPPTQRAILEELRRLVEEAAPEATASIKWGMPFYSLEGEMLCALAGFKSHVNLILPGAPGTFADPKGLLEGESKLGRHLKVRTLDELPQKAVRGWLRTAVSKARERARG